MSSSTRKQIDFLIAKSEMIDKFVEAGVNFNMATIMNKWIAKRCNLEKAKFDLAVICGEEKAMKLFNEAYTLYNETEWV